MISIRVEVVNILKFPHPTRASAFHSRRLSPTFLADSGHAPLPPTTPHLAAPLVGEISRADQEFFRDESLRDGGCHISSVEGAECVGLCLSKSFKLARRTLATLLTGKTLIKYCPMFLLYLFWICKMMKCVTCFSVPFGFTVKFVGSISRETK
jgi:hypothetical protein